MATEQTVGDLYRGRRTHKVLRPCYKQISTCQSDKHDRDKVHFLCKEFIFKSGDGKFLGDFHPKQ